MNKSFFVVATIALLLTACGGDSPPDCDTSDAINYIENEAVSNRLQPALQRAHSSLSATKQTIATADAKLQQELAQAEENSRERQQKVQRTGEDQIKRLQSELDNIRGSLDAKKRKVRQAERAFAKVEKNIENKKATVAEAMKNYEAGWGLVADALKEVGMAEDEIADIVAEGKDLSSRQPPSNIIGGSFRLDVLYPLAVENNLTKATSSYNFSTYDPLGKKFHKFEKDLGSILGKLSNAKLAIRWGTNDYSDAKVRIHEENKLLQNLQQKIQSLIDKQEQTATDTANRIQAIANKLPNEKRAIIARSAQLNDQYKTDEKRYENLISYLEKGEFSLSGIRTMGVSEATKSSECIAELKFASKGGDPVTGNVRYALQRSSDGEIYIEANLPQIF